MPRIRLPDRIADLVRTLHPDIKKRVRAALSRLLTDPYAGKLLKEELEGLLSLSVGKMRIIYRVAEDGDIDVINIGPRKTIYLETYRLLSRGKKGR